MSKVSNLPFPAKNAVRNAAIIKEMTTIFPISEVPFTSISVIKVKIMNKVNHYNEIILKFLLYTLLHLSVPSTPIAISSL